MGQQSGLHFVSYNYSAYSDVTAIITKPFSEPIPGKPWPLVKNGDLLKRNIAYHIIEDEHRLVHLGDGDTAQTTYLQENVLKHIRSATLVLTRLRGNPANF